MKSKILEKILLVLLFSAFAFIVVSCSKSDDKEDLPDTVSDEDSSDDAEPAGDTDSEQKEDADATPENPDPTPDNSDSADDSDAPEGDTGADDEQADETDTDFEKEAEGCTMIEVPKITIGGAYADEVDGYFSPAMGDANIDYIHIYLYNRVEGEYELGTGKNATYANCSECVTVTVDEAEAVANEYYFQTSGTLKITKVATVDEVERTSGEIRNLILKQAEPVDHFEDMEFIDNGKCVAAKIIEWDTTGEPGY